MHFQGYDATTRTLSWSAATLTASGEVTYQVTVADGADELAQPLQNLAVIDSDQTDPEEDDSDVFVPTVPAAETSKPTLPPTDAVADAGTTAPTGTSLSLVLVALAGLATPALGLIPARTVRRSGQGTEGRPR